MKLSKIFLYTFSTIGTIAVGSYLAILFILPPILNSPKMVKSYEKYLSKKTNLQVEIKDFKFKTNPNLSFNLSIGKFLVSNGEIINIYNFKYKTKSFSIKPNTIDVKSIFVDYEKISQLLKNKNETQKTEFNIKYLPLINIQEVFVKIDKNSNIQVQNIKAEKIGDVIICHLVATLSNPYTKNPIIIGKTGAINYYKEISFDNLSAQLENSNLYFSGSTNNLQIKGTNLPVRELEESFLYFYKIKNPKKKNFIENFTNFSGTIDIALNLKNRNLIGKCKTKNLAANFSKFNISIYLPKTIFDFNNHEINAKTSGLFGGEKVFTDFHLTGLFSKDLITSGNVEVTLTNKFTTKYFPQVGIMGKANAEVKYKTQNKVPKIKYILTIPQGSNLISKYGNLDCTNKTRRIFAYTEKHGDRIYLKNYDYSFLGATPQKLLTGIGLFEKVKGHYSPQYITIKTLTPTPVEIFQSFIKNYVQGGNFTSDLKIDFPTKTILGKFTLNDIYHKDFLYLKTIAININKNDLNLTSDGTFFTSPMSIKLNADNNFKSGFLIHDIEIYLNKFIVKRGNYSAIGQNFKDKKPTKSSNYNVTVERGKINVGEISHTKFNLKNVEILGALKNNNVQFVIPQTQYAKGNLSAKGTYNLLEHSSDIQFFASDIDSNEVATHIFNLPNQVQGSAFATLHLITKNKLNDIKASTMFAIDDGFLPKLGSTEFIINKSKRAKKSKWLNFDKIKFSLSKITNIDFSNKKVLAANITGTFNIDNTELNDIKIYSQSDYLSTFIEGKYHIDSQFAHLYIWGRHNKTAEKKIRILKIPFTFLYKIIFRAERSKDFYQDKIDMIPPIKLNAGDIESLFRVYACGNINSNNLKVILKDLK